MKKIAYVLGFILLCGFMSHNDDVAVYYRFDHSGVINQGFVDATPLACWNFSTAVGAYPDDCSGYVMTVNGAPTRRHDGTYPAGFAGTQGYEWVFDGAADYLSRADDGSFDMDLTHNPTGDFSVQCALTPDFSSDGVILSKWNAAGNQRGWYLYENGAGTLGFYISDDGTGGAHQSGVTKNGLDHYRPAFVTATYEYGTPATMNLYIDNLAVSTNAAAVSPVFNSSADFAIAAIHGGATLFEGTISACIIWKGVVLTENQHDLARDDFCGMLSASNNIPDIACASPSALIVSPANSGVEPFIIHPPANMSRLAHHSAAVQGINSPIATTSFIERGCFVSGTTGWTPATGGAATIAADTTTMAYGDRSVLFTHAGAGDTSQMDSACKTDNIGADMEIEVMAKDDGDTSSCLIQLLEWDNNDCTNILATTNILAATDIATDWTEYRGVHLAATWNAATSSWFLRLICQNTGGGYSVNWGYAQAFAGNYNVHHVTCCDTSANCVANHSIASDHSRLDANGVNQIEGVVSSSWAGTDLAADMIVFTDGNAAAANSINVSVDSTTDELEINHYDATPAVLSITPNVLNWAADTAYVLRATFYGDGNLRLWWNAAWQTATAGVGTGIRSAAQATSYICNSHNTGSNATCNNVLIRRRAVY